MKYKTQKDCSGAIGLAGLFYTPSLFGADGRLIPNDELADTELGDPVPLRVTGKTRDERPCSLITSRLAEKIRDPTLIELVRVAGGKLLVLFNETKVPNWGASKSYMDPIIGLSDCGVEMNTRIPKGIERRDLTVIQGHPSIDLSEYSKHNTP